MKMLSLIKACFSQDMQLFRYKTKKNASKKNKLLLPIILFIIVAFSVGSYAYAVAELLEKVNEVQAVLSVFLLLVTVLAFVEGIYKSQGILFDSKDTEMLFAMPIKKSHILFVRIAKLFTFEYLFNLMILLPAFSVYALFIEKITVSFVLISLLMTILVPIIPTVISSFIGYAIKMLSTNFKKTSIIQTVITSFVMVGIIFVSFSFKNNVEMLTDNISSINESILNIYYPIKLYMNLINSFNIVDLILLIAINLLPLVLFIFIGTKFYFKIISKSKNHAQSRQKSKKEISYKRQSKIKALLKKEVKRYTSSSVYMVNTIIGLVMQLIGTILIVVKGEDVMNMFSEFSQMNMSVSIMFFIFIIFTGFMTSISSSSISLEGKTINLTKSMPVSEKTILKSKVLLCEYIELPFFIISNIVFIVRFMPGIIEIIGFLVSSILIILINAYIGLLVNLKYPKMDALNDTEVVKQSTSSMVSVFIGLGMFSVTCAVTFVLAMVNPKLAIISTCSILALFAFILYILLSKKGAKKYRSINV